MAANLGIINVRLAASPGRRPEAGQHAQAVRTGPGGTKLLVVDTDAGQATAYQIAQPP